MQTQDYKADASFGVALAYLTLQHWLPLVFEDTSASAGFLCISANFSSLAYVPFLERGRKLPGKISVLPRCRRGTLLQSCDMANGIAERSVVSSAPSLPHVSSFQLDSMCEERATWSPQNLLRQRARREE